MVPTGRVRIGRLWRRENARELQLTELTERPPKPAGSAAFREASPACVSEGRPVRPALAPVQRELKRRDVERLVVRARGLDETERV